ncbi:hypothetical protein [Sphingobacterium chungjuense]|uniref:hypothetical protein n=1 Tax=Sphingobacterium chungjuense TaxID=2675553 RepID=UPI00140D5679|nr:hypothetical protein [Sphingobacterium chungjuense]
MTIVEINDNLSDVLQINSLATFSEYKYSNSLSFLQLDNSVIHKIELLNKSYQKSVINTSIKLAGLPIGDIFYLKNQTYTIASLSDSSFYIFLAECEPTDLALSEYTFKNDYLLVHTDYVDEFHVKYSETSVVWGGFKLSENASVINYHTKEVPVIEIGEELKSLDDYAKDSIYRALEQKSAFERFLKFYHLLELEFDYGLIKKIKQLNIPNESNTIGDLLNEYNRSELERLTDLLTSYCNDISSLAEKLNTIRPYKALGAEIFIKFGKGTKTNMRLNDQLKFEALIDDTDAFKTTSSVSRHASVAPGDYNKFILSITAYWIYRIRCSIAHFKIGEYILTRDKEDFIVEFAEPLIKEVLIQFYKK